MKKKFILNLILLVFLNLLIKPFYIFFIDRTVQNVVGTQEYGIYFMIYNFTFVINIFLDMGIVNFNNRHIAQNSQKLKSYFPSIVSLRLLLGVVYAVIAFAGAAIMGYSPRQMYLLGILAFNQFLLSFILYLRSNISGLLMFTVDSLVSVLDRVLLIIFCLILLYSKHFAGNFKIEWFIYSQTAAYALTALAAFCIVARKSGFKTLKWDGAFFVNILKQSFPYALLTLLMACYNRIDLVMLKQLIPGTDGEIQAGIYAHAYRLLEALNNFSYLFAVLLLPLFSKMIASKENVKGIVSVAFNLLTVFSFAFASICLFYSYDFMNVLYDDEVLRSAKVCQLLMFCLPGMSFGYVFGTLLTANGSLKQLNILATIGVVLNVSLNLVLIPKFGVIGAACTGIVTQSSVALMQLFCVKKIFKYDVNKTFILKFIRFVTYIFFLFFIGFLITKINIQWYYGCLLHLITCCVLAVAFKMFNIRELFEMVGFKRKR